MDLREKTKLIAGWTPRLDMKGHKAS